MDRCCLLRALIATALTALVIFTQTACTKNDARQQRNDTQDVIVIKEVSVRTLDGSLPERTAVLPSQHLRSPRDFKQFELQGSFEIRDISASALWGLYIESFSHGGQVRVNGYAVGSVTSSTEASTVWHTRPYLFTFPVEMLHPGTNTFSIQWGARESLTLLTRMYAGPAEVLAPPFRNRLFWQNTMALVALVHALVIAAILLGIYAVRRHQTHYLSLGVGAIGFSIIMLTYMLPPIPGWLYPYWRATHIGGIALFTSGAWLFLIREASPASRWFRNLCLAWGAGGPVIYLIHFALTDLSFFKSFETAWGGLSGLIGLYPVTLLILKLWRQWTWRNFIFVLATLCAIAMGISDILLQGTAKGVFSNVGYSLQMVSPMWFTALTVVLVMDFADSLILEDTQRNRMEAELRRQENELNALYAANLEIDREKTTLQERQRIMQDMHDGLGSHLISSLAMSERGQLSPNQIHHLLRDCIDDLRLAIDSYNEHNNPFGVALGNLRFRMAPRMKAAGIRLAWHVDNDIDNAQVPPSMVLPLLRILQECMTNVLKHAHATDVSILVRLSAEHDLHLVVRDNGIGFDVNNVRHGKGLSGIEKRARTMGGHVQFHSRLSDASTVLPETRGTTVHLTVPLIVRSATD